MFIAMGVNISSILLHGLEKQHHQWICYSRNSADEEGQDLLVPVSLVFS